MNNYRKYVWFNSLVGLGAANGLLTVLVCYFKWSSSGINSLSFLELHKEMILTSIVIGLSVTVIGNLFAKRDISKGKVSFPADATTPKIEALVPSKKPFRALMSTFYTFITTYLVTALLVEISGNSVLGLAESLIYILIISTFCSAFSAYMTIVKTSVETAQS